MTLDTLLTLLQFPQEVEKEIKQINNTLDKETLDPLITSLTYINEAEEAKDKLKEELIPDEDGIKMLTVNLLACLKVHERYKEYKISDKIYVETMKCFPRFVNDYYRRFGSYKFVEDWWTYRQTSMMLFRIGELEYEITDDSINIHIPTDASIARDDVYKSLMGAKYFLNNHFKEIGNLKATCESWLLSPEIDDFLKPTSHIKAFKSFFELTEVDPDAHGFKQWLFDTKVDAPDESLKEDNSLRKAVKHKLLEGGKIGTGTGTLKKEYW